MTIQLRFRSASLALKKKAGTSAGFERATCSLALHVSQENITTELLLRKNKEDTRDKDSE